MTITNALRTPDDHFMGLADLPSEPHDGDTLPRV